MLNEKQVFFIWETGDICQPCKLCFRLCARNWDKVVKVQEPLLNNLKMANIIRFLARMLFDICFDIRLEVEYFALELSHIRFAFYST